MVKKKFLYADICNASDVNDEYLDFDIFDDSVQIVETSDDFLKQIYEINNISDVVTFLNNFIDNMPIYSQKRILKAIFEVYYKFVEFPKLLFSEKILDVLEDIYKLKKISQKKFFENLEDFEKKKIKYEDIYDYFVKNYNL